MDIGSGTGWPSAALSNFTPHPFVIDGVACASMEGFLQSLKFKEPAMQVEVCKLVGKAAKFKGKKKKWWRTQTLYWKGVEYKRDSEEYQELLDRAFDALAENASFQKALLATNNATLTHSIGKSKIQETVLTKQEFCSRLTRIRDELQKGR
jgi:MoCo/4Fe-4S cofactor protein with predicted Tat translocation signal